MTHTIPRALNIFIILGLLALAAVLSASLALKQGFFARLGEEGAVCGGPQRRPCKPGLVCSVSPLVWAERYGTCVSDHRPAASSGQAGTTSTGGAN